MFILSDGKNYVMENPMQPGKYIMTTSVVQAKHFYFQTGKITIAKQEQKAWLD